MFSFLLIMIITIIDNFNLLRGCVDFIRGTLFRTNVLEI
jgi:hypothetical protein